MGGAFNEIGRLGTNRWGGYIYEEFHRELRGRKGIETYKEMSENDSTIGAALLAIELLIRQVKWDIQAAGNTVADKEAAEFVDSCMGDMDDTWTDFISEVLSFLTYGWSYHEIVYKRRMGNTHRPETKSKYTDGLIGWRKIPIRSQDTLWEWAYDDKDNLRGIWQSAPPDYKQVFIPVEKSLHFKTKSRKGNPEGKSVLRNAYRPWYFKRRIQEIEGIGIERDLAGLPMIEAPEDVNIWDSDDPDMMKMRQTAERIVQSVRRDQREGIVIGNGFKFSLLSTGGRRQFDTNAIIGRYDRDIAMSLMADFILLGHEQVGSYALSSDKTELFAVAIGAYLDVICEVFNNQAIPRLIDINGEHFKGITGYPELIHGDIETQDLEKLGAFVRDMVGIGAITPDEPMEEYLRMTADLPEKDISTAYLGDNAPTDDSKDQTPKPAAGEADNGDPDEPDEIEE